MVHAQALALPADGLVRAQHNRCLPDGEKSWPHASAGAALGEITFTLPSRHGQKAREVRQELWAKRLELPAGPTGTVAATCIIAREIGAPVGVKPVEWRLLTNRLALALSDVIELVDWYRARWEIEIFFNIFGVR